MGLDTKIDWPPDRRSTHNFNIDFELLLSHLTVAVVKSEKLVAEAGESSETQRKGNVRCWKPIPRNG
jgi:hypothetical protein